MRCAALVQGEAIAFVLGGSKKMLRAQNLRSLVNQEGGSNTAEVRCGRERMCRCLQAAAALHPASLHHRPSLPLQVVLELSISSPPPAGDDAPGQAEPEPELLRIRKTLIGSHTSLAVQQPGAQAWRSITQV